MSNPARDLGRIQRWMQSVIMHPGGVESGMASAEARRHIDAAPNEIETLIHPSRALSATERLAIYHRAYFARLLECLRAEFPVLLHAVGQEAFDALALGYLQKYPSRSYTLGQLAGRFTQYLAETRPENGSGGEPAPSWPDFVIDLARLEWSFDQVFDGPGVENDPVLGAEDLLAIAPGRWPETRLVPVPCLSLLALRYPVNAYFTAVRKGEDPPIPEPAETFVAITRRRYVVRHYPLSRTQFELLSALVAGQSVGDAIAAAADRAGGDLDDLAENLRTWFRHWAAEGLFSGCELPEAPAP